MSRSKTATPVVADSHPAHALTFVDPEIKEQLLKTPTHLLLEQESYQQQLKELRSDWRYAFVIQWITYFRGTIRMANDPFTIDVRVSQAFMDLFTNDTNVPIPQIVEEELVGLTEPSLMPKIATNLCGVLLNTKVTMADFSFRARFLIGEYTKVLGTEDEPLEYESLSLVDKFEVLYTLITVMQYNEAFRKQVEKYDRQPELRFDPIFDDGKISYFLLSDNRIYKRTLIKFPDINIPKKYKYAKLLDPEVDFAEIEPEVEWECVAIGIYQIHDFLESIKGKTNLRPLFKNIKEHIDDLAAEDLVTRKKILKRKREQQLHDLVSNRKRSSRLQEKEEQTKIEKQKQEEEEERQREILAKSKAKKRFRAKLKQLEHEAEERLRRQTSSRRAALLENYKPSSTEEIHLEDGDWLFDCYCGIREKNYDDGVKLLRCERCNRWQHLKCQDRTVRQELVKNADEVFVCLWCYEEIERDIAKKLEDERIQREKEAEEKIRQREVQKQRDEQERIRREEEEQKRKEELERERERRLLERAKMGTPDVEKVPEVESNAPAPIPIPTPPQQQTQQQPQQAVHQQTMNGPSMGTFQQPPPQHFQPHPQTQNFFPHHQMQQQHQQHQFQHEGPLQQQQFMGQLPPFLGQPHQMALPPPQFNGQVPMHRIPMPQHMSQSPQQQQQQQQQLNGQPNGLPGAHPNGQHNGQPGANGSSGFQGVLN